MRSVACVLAALSAIIGCSSEAASGNAAAGAGATGVATAGASGGGAGGALTGVSGAGTGGSVAGGTGGAAAGGIGGSAGATAGSGGAAGAGGSVAGAGGAAGAAGAAGAGGGSGLTGAVPSMGCGTAVTDTPEMFVQHDLTVLGHARSFFVRLPADYNPMRAYPLTIMGPGCGGSGDMSIPIQDAAGPDAIVVGLNISAEVTGRDCFMTESDTSPELDYFDAMWAEMSAGYCIDTARVLYGGFSSGAWLANLLGCARSNILRVQGSAAGGFPPIPECPEPIAAIMIHDDADNTNGIGGVMAARDRILEKNGCTGTELGPWDAEFPDCQMYTGCPAEYPLVWCMTNNGSGHSPQDELSAPAFWKFLMSLPPKP